MINNHISVINLFNICRDNEWKANNWNHSKGHNFVKNCSLPTIVNRTLLDLDMLMIKLLTKFLFSMCNLFGFQGACLHCYTCSIEPKTEINLAILMINLYIKYQISFQCVQPLGRKWTETAKTFSKFLGHSYVKNCSNVSKPKLDLDILIINVNTEY